MFSAFTAMLNQHKADTARQRAELAALAASAGYEAPPAGMPVLQVFKCGPWKWYTVGPLFMWLQKDV